MYVPSAWALTRGGYFVRRPDGSPLYDTIISAQHVLKSVRDAHAPQLKQLPLRGGGGGAGEAGGKGGGGGTVLDLVDAGLATDDVSACHSVLLRGAVCRAAAGHSVLCCCGVPVWRSGGLCCRW